jgi:hypothetical protein
MWVYDEPNFRVVDQESGASLRRLLRRGYDINLFVLDWGGRRIPFWGEDSYDRDPVSDTELIRWKVGRLGLGYDSPIIPESSVESYRFASAEERATAIELILEGMRALFELNPRIKRPIVEVSLGLAGEATP